MFIIKHLIKKKFIFSGPPCKEYKGAVLKISSKNYVWFLWRLQSFVWRPEIFLFFSMKNWLFSIVGSVKSVLLIYQFKEGNCQGPTFNPIPAGGGGQFAPPPVVFFLHNSKSIGLRLLKFSDFSYIPKALPLGLKPGFNTNCQSPQAHCLNDCFCL